MPRRHRESVSPITQQKPNVKHHHYDCQICRRDHPLRKCLKFKKMNISGRLKVVNRFNYCENCLAHSHRIAKCRSIDRCKGCGAKHHTLLHRHERLLSPGKKPHSKASTAHGSLAAVIPTVIIKLKLNNEWGQVRGLLNPCAEYSSIAAFLVERYHLPVEKLGSEKWCTLSFRSRFEEGSSFTLNAKVTNDLPTLQARKRLDDSVSDYFQNLRLADPDFFTNGSINIVLGADIYPQLIRSGIQIPTLATAMAQDTKLGWVIIGKFGS